MKEIFQTIGIFLLSILFVKCGAVQRADDFIRGEQKNLDIAISPYVTPSMLQQMKSIGVNVNGVNAQTGQFIFAQGQGTTNPSIYTDMLTKEFMKAGFKARTITENITESSPKEKFIASNPK